MRKLPDEGLRRKSVDRAGDLIKSNGHGCIISFINFVREAAQRFNNGYGKELKFFSMC